MRKEIEDYVGTCQGCLGEYKVDNSREIVLHGYERPGNGSIKGACIGVGYVPFEYGTALTTEVISSYRIAATMAEAMHAQVEAALVTELPRAYTAYDPQQQRRVERVEMIGPESEHWERQVQIALARAERDVRYYTSIADYFQARVDGWKKGEIVGLDVPPTGKERGLREAYDPEEEERQKHLADQRAERAARPGKLKLVLCWPCQPADRLEDSEKKAAKAWARAMFPEGKLMVAEDYDSQLPRSYRRRDAFYHVLVVRPDWSYHNQVADLVTITETMENEPKQVSYLFDLAMGRPWQ